MRVTFLLSNHPYAMDAGDTHISRLLLEIAAEAFETRGLALCLDSDAEAAARATPPVPIETVRKPELELPKLALKSLATNRSIVHTYFRVPELTEAVRRETCDAFLAEHTFMSEAVFDAGRAGSVADGTRLLINTHALQSSVLEQRPGPLRLAAKVEARRTWRDELRCIRGAESAATLGGDDLDRLQSVGLDNLSKLDLLLPPAPRAAGGERPRALFIGTRYRWPPNQYALKRMLELWPTIAAAMPEAELIVTGRPASGEKPVNDPSVQIAGFVDDLDELLDTATVLLAPVPVGGGVRVKLLEAARHGLPVVATPEAVGSLSEYLPVAPAKSDEDFCAAAIELLASGDRAKQEGERLYEANRELWEAGFVHKQVEGWITGASGNAGASATAENQRRNHTD